MAKIEEQKFPKELVSDVAFIDYATPVSRVRQNLKNMPAAVIQRNGEYYGILDSKSLTGWGSLNFQEKEKAGKLAVRVPKISSSTTVSDMAYYFYKLRVKNLPYYYGGKIVGVVERSTLLKMLLSLKALDDLTVKEAMSSPVLAIDSHATLSQAFATMIKDKVKRLVVLEKGRFVGLVTKNDIHLNYSKGNERFPSGKRTRYNPSNISIDSIMERNVKTITDNYTLAEAARWMVEGDISSLVVVKGQNPFGIITVSDILEKIVAKKRIEDKRVFISGFEESTYQYEESVREELKALMLQLEAMHKVDVEYASMVLKTVGRNYYEMQARISLGSKGVIRVHSEGKSFHDAFSDLMKKMKHLVIKEKETVISKRKNRKRGVEYE